MIADIKTFNTNGNNIKMVFRGIAVVMVVLLGLSAAFACVQMRRGQLFVPNGVAYCMIGVVFFWNTLTRACFTDTTLAIWADFHYNGFRHNQFLTNWLCFEPLWSQSPCGFRYCNGTSLTRQAFFGDNL